MPSIKYKGCCHEKYASEELSITILLKNIVIDYLTDYSADDYELESVKELADLDVGPIFRSKRISVKRNLFEYECADEVLSAEDPEKR